ncbi:hypothetical protein C0995_008066, partial [Termitomyces sp. Mi166
ITTPMEAEGTRGTCTKRSEYYARFIPDETTRCFCGIRFQTREHVIKECPKYGEHRHILEDADAQMELGVLLGSKKGLEAMAKFLAKTGAFHQDGEEL